MTLLTTLLLEVIDLLIQSCLFAIIVHKKQLFSYVNDCIKDGCCDLHCIGKTEYLPCVHAQGVKQLVLLLSSLWT